MKKIILFVLSFILIIAATCWCQPQNNNASNNTIKKPTFDYDINYTIPEYSNSQHSNIYDISNMVYITKTGKCYHIGYCSHAKQSTGYMSRSQATKKGYRPCYYCCY